MSPQWDSRASDIPGHALRATSYTNAMSFTCECGWHEIAYYDDGIGPAILALADAVDAHLKAVEFGDE